MAAPRVNRTTFAVLGYLTCWGPMSGYDIKRALEGSAANFWAESYGQLYPILRRLAEEGLVRPVDGGSGTGRGRRVFEATERGRDALDAWVREPAELPTVRHELLLKLFFGKRASPEDLRRHIENHRAAQQAMLEKYEGIRRGLEASYPESEDLPFWRITLRYGEREGRAQIDWCNETLEELTRIEPGPTPRAGTQRGSKKAGGTAHRRTGARH